MRDFEVLTIAADGSVRTQGQETGPRRVYSVRGDTLVIYQEGSHYWAGIGRPQNYAPAEWRVYSILDIEPIELRGAITVRAALLVHMPARTGKEDRAEAALETVGRLEREERSRP